MDVLMTLGQMQRKLPPMIAKLIIWAYDNGYELTFGDAFRDPRVHGFVGQKFLTHKILVGGQELTYKAYGKRNSAHKQKLAIDLNLFKNGEYLTKTEDHRPLGEFWESMGGTWGGRFADGNHYSLEYNGVK